MAFYKHIHVLVVFLLLGVLTAPSVFAGEGEPCFIPPPHADPATAPPPIHCEGTGYYCRVTNPTSGAGVCECSFGAFEVLGSLIFTGSTSNICDYVSGGNTPLLDLAVFIIKYVTLFIVMAALIAIVIAGYIYMTAGGDGSRVTLAKTILWSALLGIFLAMTAFLLLNTISPQFVDVSEPNFGTPAP